MARVSGSTSGEADAGLEELEIPRPEIFWERCPAKKRILERVEFEQGYILGVGDGRSRVFYLPRPLKVTKIEVNGSEKKDALWDEKKVIFLDPPEAGQIISVRHLVEVWSPRYIKLLESGSVVTCSQFYERIVDCVEKRSASELASLVSYFTSEKDLPRRKNDLLKVLIKAYWPQAEIKRDESKVSLLSSLRTNLILSSKLLARCPKCKKAIWLGVKKVRERALAFLWVPENPNVEWDEERLIYTCPGCSSQVHLRLER